jgi:hypothetical protein
MRVSTADFDPAATDSLQTAAFTTTVVESTI